MTDKPHITEMHITETAPGRTTLLDGVEYLFFGGTGYLGMHRNAAFMTLFKEGLEKYGPVYGSSRASNLQMAIFGTAEDRLAGWLAREACTVLSSGFMAGQLVLHCLQREGYQLHHAPGSHPALLSGCLTPPECSREEWSRKIDSAVAAGNDKQAILTSSLDPLGLQPFDFSFASRLPGEEIVLVIDDSHGLGLLGEGGEGIIASLSQPVNAELIILGSLGKGMGIPAGAIWSSAGRARMLRETAFFIGASPPAPAGLHAFLHAGDLYREARQKLKWNVLYFSKLIKGLKRIRQAAELPVFVLEDEQAGDHLLKKHILISSFAYPYIDSQPLNRIILSSLHKADDLERLASVLKDYLPE